MSYGLAILNNSSQIVISDGQYNPVFYQRAYCSGGGQWVWTTGSNGSLDSRFGSGTQNAGYSTRLSICMTYYDFSMPTNYGVPIPFILQDSTLNYGCAINSIVNNGTSGSNTNWRIWVNCGSAIGANFSAGANATLLIFGQIPPTTTATGYGIRIPNNNVGLPTNVAFDSNLKHLIASSILSYSTSTATNSLYYSSGGTNYYSPSIDYNSRQLISNLPTTAAFYYVNNLSDCTYYANFGSSYNNNNIDLAIGRINGGYFETTIGITSNQTSQSAFSRPRGNEPVIIIDSSKYV